MRYLAAVLLVSAVVGAAAHGAAAQPPGPPGGGSIAERACTQIQAKLGADVFEQRFGTLEECVAKLEPAAEAALAECREAHEPGSQEFQSCMRSRIQATVKQQAGGGGANVANAAKTICTKIRQKLGAERFERRFETLAGCTEEVEPTAKAAVEACAKKGKPGSTAFKQCVADRVRKKVSGTGTTKAADQLAAKVCAQARKQLGAKGFERRFGSQERCLSTMVTRAQEALQACASEGEPGSAAFKRCVQQRLKKR